MNGEQKSCRNKPVNNDDDDDDDDDDDGDDGDNGIDDRLHQEVILLLCKQKPMTS